LRISRSTLSTMFHGSSPSADRSTPITIESRMSRTATQSGEPPKNLSIDPFAMFVLRQPAIL
jgi:hypothetical protein